MDPVDRDDRLQRHHVLAALIEASGTAAVSNQVIWRPDAVGSVLFLVSSAIALMPDVRRHRHGHARDRSWSISTLNMVGSIFFGISAVGAYVVPATDDLLNARWSNGGTFLVRSASSSARGW